MMRLKFFIEEKVFGVCSFLGTRLGISSRHIRLFFIYASFINMTSPLIIYLVLAFWVNMKRWVGSAHSLIWD